jgi:GNAT superfamily N-acetyltransferase
MPDANAASTVRRIEPSELEWANARYEEADFVPSSAEDLIVVAEVGGEKAGLGRVVSIDTITGELGGMYVLPAFRGANVARSIVQALIDASSHQTLFCIPFMHLTGFYGSFGFREADRDITVPEAVRKKVDWCNRHYPNPVALMVLRRNR